MTTTIPHSRPWITAADVQAVGRVLRRGSLAQGAEVGALEAEVGACVGLPPGVAVNSGTAALHLSLLALGVGPGDEVIVPSYVCIAPVHAVEQVGATPRLADVDPRTYNLDPGDVRRRCRRRTRAIIVPHLFGLPADLDALLRLGVPVIEDCAQAFGAASGGRPVGAIGKIGCFSLQQGKHITTGEGGLVVTSDEAVSRRMFLFINKAWGYGDAKPDHYFLAPNYRMNELTGAVALAQLAKLGDVVRRRIRTARTLSALLAGIKGLTLPAGPSGGVHSFWKYAIMVDPDVIPGGAQALGAALAGIGIPCAPRYIQKPAFECQIFREQRTFGQSRFPFSLARPEALDYRPALFPGAYAALERVLVLPWNERYTEEHVDHVAGHLRSAITRLGGTVP